MRAYFTGIAAALTVATTAGTAQAEVRVTFVNPQGYTDAGLYRTGSVGEDAPALVGLRRIFERLGQRLPPGQDLQIEVSDIDLAGYFPPWGPANPAFRVMEPTTWPRINLRYTVTRDGHVVSGGEATITDMTYLRRPMVARSSDPLRYEDAMLRDWFADRLGTSPQLMTR
ncbi:DUF3016 domain-containing protein [Roseomonas terrae]|uniref:DUF3016 domain-containing protein n=1 Tax=Neoroseomonas terrae TaxID=424799 RepID=A0ABS5EEB7_9PROT|nr:DUF3016 domain-containing protein [Neoroseomonas terrae]MBR0649357.1 DUF3016 domain-containing protein [Neoroseomonas terrae]